ncbi:MAG: squalene synthase HpnC [Pseudomonadota bacterium]
MAADSNAPTAAGGSAGPVEAPSGKGAGDENFPVGSFLIARKHRPAVMAYYAFARGTDDIADDATLAPQEKIRRLDACEAGLMPGATNAPEMAARLGAVLRETGVEMSCATDLLIAFRQDALKARYADWDDLIGYCANSARPVGRFLLQLHGEDPGTAPASDALCDALQVLNHLQDIAVDKQRLDRVYLPQDWLEAEGVNEAALTAPAASPGLRRVIDRCLAGCAALLETSRPLADQTRSRRMAAEIAVIQRLAERLHARLGREDPLAGPVKHSRVDLVAGLGAGLWRLLSHRPSNALPGQR